MKGWEQRDKHRVSHTEVRNLSNIFEGRVFSVSYQTREKRIQTEGRRKPKAGKQSGGRRQEAEGR